MCLEVFAGIVVIIIWQTSQETVQCGPGFYKQNNQCVACPNNTYQSEYQNKSECESCVSYCDPLPISLCSSASTPTCNDTTDGLSCLLGSYNLFDENNVFLSGPYFLQPTQNKKEWQLTYQSGCLQCEDGKYYDSFQNQCVKCSSETELNCPASNQAFNACSDYQNAFCSDCNPCEAGTYLYQLCTADSDTRCLSCPEKPNTCLLYTSPSPRDS